MESLTEYLHDFCRENERTGRVYDEKWHKVRLMMHIIGFKSLVDEITYQLTDEVGDAPTATAILRDPFGQNFPKALDFDNSKPIENAELDVWHTEPIGLYEQQDPKQPDMNFRSRFATGAECSYNIPCLRPTSYPLSSNGPTGQLPELRDRHSVRPAYIYLIITAPGYKPPVTEISDTRSNTSVNNSSFAVQDSLLVELKPRQGDPKAQLQACSFEAAKNGGMKGRTEGAP